MRFHVPSLPHTSTTSEHLACAYTQKVVKMCQMMMHAGHEVYLYASPENTAPCTEHIVCAEPKPHDRNKPYHPTWDPKSKMWSNFNTRVIEEMRPRLEARDFICLIGGNAMQVIADEFPAHMSVEFGIGYEGVFAKYQVFESYAWMHHVYGLQKLRHVRWYDAVIPNYFDPDQFPANPSPRYLNGDRYLLWVGRWIKNKGPHIAVEIARNAGLPLIMAGQGAEQRGSTISGAEVTVSYDGATHVGPINVEQRVQLMTHAEAILVPTEYLGPFEGVAVEAMLCGTPVIAPDFGCFSEYIQEGKNGYRFRTLREAIGGVHLLPWLDGPLTIRNHAMKNYSMYERPLHQYLDYFYRLEGLWGQGWTDTERCTSSYGYGIR